MNQMNALSRFRSSWSHFSDGVRDRWAAAPGWQRWAVYILLIIGALLLPSESLAPIMSPYSDWASVLFFPIGTFVVLAIGLNVVVGQAGLLDLGFVAFYAVGGYAMGLLGTRLGWNFWEILVVGILICALSGVVLGAPTLRLRGDYLAIVTLGFGEIIRITARNTDEIGGPNGIRGIPHPPSIEGFELFGIQVFKYGVLDPRPYYYMLVALAVIVIILVKRWEKSRVGRAWAAIREDEDAAEVMGVPTFRFKMLAFAIGASIGGAMGVVWAAKVISINPNDFLFLLSATILAAVVMGGAGNLPGVMLGAFIVAWLPERFRGLQEYRMLIFGAVLVALMIFKPEGLLPSRQRKAELKGGTGGMGSLGADVPGPETKADVIEGADK
ncbi:branched-chain amino acid ABC transporter permease [Nonomuraea dietziae]|jgi:branched-chain amino acid transport system permease protein|uniref:Branched-chain amino acid transport system permease protein n=1 Tax=Nonomuraea dietziae TaxID=65515 RepID=A0A7W5YEY2_9ACTN|nr:branched-chain amino acid ABC transporter permease [Nonomuraea dietziae]MBB3732293.1 branched-chain amino acid transport system permease protein [Nonomuraea dietziae]